MLKAAGVLIETTFGSIAEVTLFIVPITNHDGSDGSSEESRPPSRYLRVYPHQRPALSRPVLLLWRHPLCQPEVPRHRVRSRQRPAASRRFWLAPPQRFLLSPHVRGCRSFASRCFWCSPSYASIIYPDPDLAISNALEESAMVNVAMTKEMLKQLQQLLNDGLGQYLTICRPFFLRSRCTHPRYVTVYLRTSRLVRK